MKKVCIFIYLFFINLLIVNAEDKVSVRFYSCIDGDTAKFVVNDKIETVRFLSINAPEVDHNGDNSEPYGNEASNYTCKTLHNASIIELQYDPKSDRKDKYDRLLAWVFVDGELLQEKLINEGLAEVKYVYDDYLYSDELYNLEVTAKENGIGMWNNDEISVNYMVYVYIGIVILILVTALFSKIKKRI